MDTEKLERLAKRLAMLRSRKFVLKCAEARPDSTKQIGKDGYTMEDYRREEMGEAGEVPYALVLEPHLAGKWDGEKSDMQDMARAMTEFLQSEYEEPCREIERQIRAVLDHPKADVFLDDPPPAPAPERFAFGVGPQLAGYPVRTQPPAAAPVPVNSEYPAMRRHQLDPSIPERRVETAEESDALGPDWGPLPYTPERAKEAATAVIDLSVCRSCGGEAKAKIIKNWRGKPTGVQVLCANCRRNLAA
jgi:hypothetical protein